MAGCACSGHATHAVWGGGRERLAERWVCSPAAAACPDAGHLATDVDGSLLLHLHSKAAQRTSALRLPAALGAQQVEVACTLPALAIAAVCATRRADAASLPHSVPPRDLLVLLPDGRLALYVGALQACTVTLPAAAGVAGQHYTQLLRGEPAGATQQNLSQLSASKRFSSTGARAWLGAAGRAAVGAHPSLLPPGPTRTAVVAGEVQSAHSGSEGDADMMIESPMPAPAMEAVGRGLPGVRELVEALEQPLEVVGLEVRSAWRVLQRHTRTAASGSVSARNAAQQRMQLGFLRIRPLCVQDAVGNRVSLLMRGGARLRVALPYAATACPLTAAVLEAVSDVLPSATWWRLYARWLGSDASCSAAADEQWAELSNVLVTWAADPARLHETAPQVPRPSGSSGTATTPGVRVQRTVSTGATLPSSTAWEQLLASEQHQQLAQRFGWAAAAPLPPDTPSLSQVAARDEVWRTLQAMHSGELEPERAIVAWARAPCATLPRRVYSQCTRTAR